MQSNRSKKSLVGIAGLSAILQVGGGGIATIIRLGCSAVLARLLDPEDFGILGVGIIALEAIAHLGNLGINAGIISKDKIEEADLSTGFWLLLANRIILFSFSFAIAPLVAYFFNEPRVCNVFRACSVIFLFSALDAVPRALITKRLDYLTLSLIQIGGSISEGIIAIWLAYSTNLRYWSLIIGMLSTYLLTLIVLYAKTKWFPKLRWSKISFKYYLPFMMNGIGGSIVLYLKNNIDYLLVGRILGVRQLGFYEFAYKVPHAFVRSFVMPLSNILHPLLSKVQNSTETVASGYFRAMRLISIVSFPAMLGLASVSDILVPVLWGNKWLSIITPLKILCFSGLINCFCAPIEFLFLAKQRPDLVFRMHMSTFLVTAISVIILGYFMQLNGVAFGMSIGAVPGIYFVISGCKLVKASVKALFQMALRILSLALCCSLISFAVCTIGTNLGYSDFLVLIVSIISAIFAYILLIWLFNREALNEFVILINEVLGKELINPLGS